MKWFFAVTAATSVNDSSQRGEDHKFTDCIRAAVRSAKENTSLKPHMVFDGEECDFTREIEKAGAKVILRRLSWYDRLKQAQKRQRPDWSSYMPVAAGAFLRLEIPLLEKEDKHVLYTDCDVMFLKDPDLSQNRPEIFAAAGQFNQQDYYRDMNSGVMVMNLDRMRNDLPAMIDFMCSDFAAINGFDQELLRIFYNGCWSPLPGKYNWKPYWGANEEACILHFHGAKPVTAKKWIKDPDYRQDDPGFEHWRHWFFENQEGYVYYLKQWDEYLLKSSETKSTEDLSSENIQPELPDSSENKASEDAFSEEVPFEEEEEIEPYKLEARKADIAAFDAVRRQRQ